jgi:hypothetical protein
MEELELLHGDLYIPLWNIVIVRKLYFIAKKLCKISFVYQFLIQIQNLFNKKNLFTHSIILSFLYQNKNNYMLQDRKVYRIIISLYSQFSVLE